jgi:predicted heme/steroid binding protein
MVDELPGKEQVFSKRELSRYDGEMGPAYIAYEGIVYDVSSCPKWRKALHEGLHFPGQDLTEEIVAAPHFDEVFSHPCVKRVGVLINTQ